MSDFWIKKKKKKFLNQPYCGTCVRQSFPAQVTLENMVNVFVGKVSKWCFVADIAVRVEDVWDARPHSREVEFQPENSRGKVQSK